MAGAVGTLKVGTKAYRIHRLASVEEAGLGKLARLPRSIRVLASWVSCPTGCPREACCPQFAWARSCPRTRGLWPIGIRVGADVGLVGDSRDTLRELIPLLQRKEDRSWREEIEHEIERWWEVLADRAHDKIRSLSGGQMRRVEIARALLHRPRLLVLDEPTVGLDIKARADILAHVHRLVAEDGVCVLWATHLIDEIDANDGLIVLHHGRMLAHGSVPDVMAQTSSGDIRAAFSALTQSPAEGND